MLMPKESFRKSRSTCSTRLTCLGNVLRADGMRRIVRGYSITIKIVKVILQSKSTVEKPLKCNAYESIHEHQILYLAL